MPLQLYPDVAAKAHMSVAYVAAYVLQPIVGWIGAPGFGAS